MSLLSEKRLDLMTSVKHITLQFRLLYLAAGELARGVACLKTSRLLTIQVTAQPRGRCDMRSSCIITDNRLSGKNKDFC